MKNLPLFGKHYLTEIPTNARINKRYTGIGGTTAELTAKRNSVILMPSFKAVKDKSNKPSPLYDIKSLYGVYGGHNEVRDLVNFISTTIDGVEYKKIILTMSAKSITTLLKAAEYCPEIYTYNLLLDEVDQIVDDGCWRNDLELCYDLVKLWRRGTVTVISATGINNIMFEPIAKLDLYEVESIKGRLSYPIDLIVDEDLESMAATIADKSDDEHIFIFYNNVQGSKRIISSLLQNDPTADCRIYCSDGSKNKAGGYYSNDTTSFGKYNFCTKAYFRAIDFNVSGEVITITDPNSLHSSLSVEDIVQCPGRIRITINKLSIIMNTKEMKTSNYTREALKEFFISLANQDLGGITTLDSMGLLTQSYLDSKESVRKDLKGNHVICYSWIEGMIKSKFDKLAHTSAKEMKKALKIYDFNANITLVNTALKVISEKLDWAEQIEFVVEVLKKTEGRLFLQHNFDDNHSLIFKGITLLGEDVTKECKNKSQLRNKVVTFEQKTKFAKEIGIMLSKRLMGLTEISSKEAKIVIGDIFKMVGYKATAKASLLSDYFSGVEERSRKVEGKKFKVYTIGAPKYKIVRVKKTISATEVDSTTSQIKLNM